MGKHDELKFKIKKTLVVGTASATLGMSGCSPISNPVVDTAEPVDAEDAQEDGVDSSEDTGHSSGDADDADVEGDTSDAGS